MSREVFDDSAILKTGGGTLNKFQKAIIGVCIEDAYSTNTDCKSIFDNVLKELKKIESDVKAGKKIIEDFDELANMYGCAAGGRKIGYVQFNTFLREQHFKSTSPKDYADMCKKVSILRAGLIKRSEELNKIDTTLYRYTDIEGVLGMLAGSGVINRAVQNYRGIPIKKKYCLCQIKSLKS